MIMSIVDNILELINEMAFEKSKAESKVTELGLPVLYHLIKIFKWNDQLNYNKHIHDINAWLIRIQDILIKPKSKRFKPEQYYKFLFEEQIKSKEDVTFKIESGIFDEYRDLKILEESDQVIYEKLKSIYKNISVDISKREFKNIRNYLN